MNRTPKGVPAPVKGNGAHHQIAVIIGGGVTGVLSAFELQRSGYSVVLLEQGGLGNGSSQRSAACLRAQFGTFTTVRGMVYARKFFENWRQITGQGEGPLTQQGYLFLHDFRQDPEEIEGMVRMQQQNGLREVEFLNPAQIGERFPYVNTRGLRCGTWCPTDGFLKPQVIYNDGAEAAKLIGAQVVTNCKVTGVKKNGNRITAVLTTKGEFACDLVVNATGAWSANVAQMLGAMSLPVVAKKRYLYYLPGIVNGDNPIMTGEEFRASPMVIGPNGAYCHPTLEDKLMMGWLHKAKPLDPDSNQDEFEMGFTPTNPGSYAEAIRQEVVHWMPAFDGMRVVSGSAGFYEETPDNHPILGYDERVPNLIHACGFSGHGLMHSPFTARIVAELAVNHADCFDLPFDLGDVDVRPYSPLRDFHSHIEGMKI